MGCTGGPPAPHTKSSEIPVLVQKEKDFLKTRPYAPLPRTNIVQIVGRGRGCCPVVDNSKKKKKTPILKKKRKRNKHTPPPPPRSKMGSSKVLSLSVEKLPGGKNKNNNHRKNGAKRTWGWWLWPQSGVLYGAVAGDTLSASVDRGVSPFGQSWAPAVRTKGKTNLNSTNSGGPGPWWAGSL